MRTTDLLYSTVIGFVIAAILLGISKNIEVAVPYLWTALIIFPVLAAIGMYIASLLSKQFFIVLEAARFLVVGALNTFIDLGVLNLLIFTTGIASGIWFTVFKGVSFIVSVINSYILNRRWTFEADNQEKGKEFAQFLVVSVIGFSINIGIASLVVNVLQPPEMISANIWANVGAVSATAISMVWNFLGYKLIVFKK